MTYTYALQVLGIIVTAGAVALGALKVGSVHFDRRTREDARRAKEHVQYACSTRVLPPTERS